MGSEKLYYSIHLCFESGKVSIVNKIVEIVVFWKRKPRTKIPSEIRTMTKSLHQYEKSAAVKVYKFAKKHFIETDGLMKLFNTELDYERTKYQIRQDFPHQDAIRKSDISHAKKLKYEKLKQDLDPDVYRKYKAFRSRQKKRYIKKK